MTNSKNNYDFIDSKIAISYQCAPTADFSKSRRTGYHAKLEDRNHKPVYQSRKREPDKPGSKDKKLRQARRAMPCMTVRNVDADAFDYTDD